MAKGLLASQVPDADLKANRGTGVYPCMNKHGLSLRELTYVNGCQMLKRQKLQILLKWRKYERHSDTGNCLMPSGATIDAVGGVMCIRAIFWYCYHFQIIKHVNVGQFPETFNQQGKKLL